MSSRFGVIDLFAGPGGLGEGFASTSFQGFSPFQIGVSVEMESSAHQTLTLRAFLREYRNQRDRLPQAFIDFHAGAIAEPNWEQVDRLAWRKAQHEARCLELGKSEANEAIQKATSRFESSVDETVLIGGPPCQAYSLVGRARARGKVDYVPEADERHYLFREYIRVLDRLRPAAFVMENVKGMLSSTVASRRVFEMLMEDLASLGSRSGHHYELRAIRVEDGFAKLQEPMQPSDFVVRAEEFGVPQRRHRVIIVGLRADIASRASTASIPVAAVQRTVKMTIGNMPALRSGISRGAGDEAEWQNTVGVAAKELAGMFRGKQDFDLRGAFLAVAEKVEDSKVPPRISSVLPSGYGTKTDDLMRWLERPELRLLSQHETRGHMRTDLLRYLFASTFGATRGFSPKASDFPKKIGPDHRNWNTGVFSDRFRVQLAGEPSTTVTSHISKDGHYFIHPDPRQCRSLTVREAARLQTFPDDYLFLGNRTQQYVQVGNAVPPYLARQIARLVLACLA